MYKRKNIVILLFVIIITGGVAACKKWVDVDAPLLVNEKTVFANEQGFRDVLNGVYLNMGDSTLYGRELTYGLLSVLGRSYDTTISAAIKNLYYKGIKYDFQDQDVKAAMARIWEGMYQCIGNLNYALSSAETRKNVFASEYSFNSFKGEALGLRAFLYTELVRLFAPSPVADPNSIAIPYITQPSPYSSTAMPTNAVIDSCIADLITAQSLLPATDANVSHITNAAVQGLLARMYLYKGDLVNARSYALGLINSKQFPLYAANPTTSTVNDNMFQKELLFSVYGSQSLMISYIKYILGAATPLGFSSTGQTALFVTGSGNTFPLDWRKAFVDPVLSTGTNLITPKKFSLNVTSYTGYNILPMMRITEMYYIAAECATAFQDSLAATTLLDSVRKHRGIPVYTQAALKSDSLGTEIAREYQKEFLAEGQAFYYYKRKNLPFNKLPFTREPLVSGASYVFIKPE